MDQKDYSSDLLGAKPHILAIEESIRSHFENKNKRRETSFNILISGKWGIGKSYILESVSKDLSKEGYTTILFNPWRYSQSTLAIKRKFLQHLHSKLGGKVNLNSLYEGVQSLSIQKSLSELVFFILNVFWQYFINVVIISGVSFAIILVLSKVLVDIFPLLLQFLKIDNQINIPGHKLEVSIIIGVIAGIIPAIKLIFDNIATKTTKAQTDSIEQFEEIFSKIVSQKKYFIMNTLFEVFVGFLDLVINIVKVGFCKWDWYDSLTIRAKTIQKINEKIGKFKKWLSEIQENINLNEYKYEKILICIDDLDRCDQKEVKNILDSFLTFFEHSNCVYIVTADHTVVEEYIKREIIEKSNGTSSKISSPREYLQKIFNLNILVPSPPKERLQKFIEETATEFNLETNAIIASYAIRFFKKNPRAIRRYFMKIRYSLDVATSIFADKHTNNDDKELAKKVKEHPEIRAKIIALELVTPSFFETIQENIQIAQDTELRGRLDGDYKYFDKNSKTIIDIVPEKDEVFNGESILVSEPKITNYGVSYESIINFSASTYTKPTSTYPPEEIISKIEQGISVYQDLMVGTSDTGRNTTRVKIIEKYDVLKQNGDSSRLNVIKGIIDLALASHEKNLNLDKTSVDWLIDFIQTRLVTEEDAIISQLSSEDFGKILETVSNSEKELEILETLLSADVIKKPVTVEKIFALTDPAIAGKNQAKLSGEIIDAIKFISKAHRGNYE